MTLSEKELKDAIDSAKKLLGPLIDNESTKNFLRNALDLSLNSRSYEEFDIRFKYLIARNKKEITTEKKNKEKKKDKENRKKEITAADLARLFDKEFSRYPKNLEFVAEIFRKLVMLHYAKKEKIEIS